MLVQVAPLPEWARRPVPLTSIPPELTETWSLRSSELPPGSPHAFKRPAAAGSFGYLGSSAAFQMLVWFRELAKKLIPSLGPDSAQELPPEPDRFAVLHRDLRDKLARPQRLPDMVPVQDWQQNQALVLPLRLKSKIQTVDSESSKATKFVVSPRKRDLTQHPRLAKILGIPDTFASKPKHPKQILQDDNGFSSTDIDYPEFPRESQRDPDEHLEAPEPVETNQLQQEALSQNLELPEEIQSSPPQQDPAQPPQPPEQEEASTQQEALAQPPGPAQEQPAQSPEHHEMTVLPLGHQQSQHLSLPGTTTKPPDLQITITAEPAAEVGTFPTYHESTAQPSRLQVNLKNL
ncbi:leucine-rich repeat-containing protein 37B-like [Cynocephalus volans]|uniref:leucine-rich repeat-containing protein 37B-like n=1 Tax=Cynocephalus volans TaxID=110931 RepID=UPI002FCCA685